MLRSCARSSWFIRRVDDHGGRCRDGSTRARADWRERIRYDPIFVPTGLDLTTAQMTPDQKDSLSHRGARCAPRPPVVARSCCRPVGSRPQPLVKPPVKWGIQRFAALSPHLTGVCTRRGTPLEAAGCPIRVICQRCSAQITRVGCPTRQRLRMVEGSSHIRGIHHAEHNNLTIAALAAGLVGASTALTVPAMAEDAAAQQQSTATVGTLTRHRLCSSVLTRPSPPVPCGRPTSDARASRSAACTTSGTRHGAESVDGRAVTQSQRRQVP